MRLRARIEYDGAEFLGWQRLPRDRTVQGTLESALEEVIGADIRVVGSGRTDAGVHATGQVAHFDTDWHIERGIATLRRAVNAVLPWDVVLWEVDEAPPGFHARHSAVCRVYRYRLYTATTRSPLRRRRTWHVRAGLDLRAMTAAASRLVGTHDFASFGRPMSGSVATTRRLDAFEVAKDGDEVRITVAANAFLRHQVRRMVGFLVDIGRGSVPVEAVEAALEGTWSGVAPRKAPPQGLTLVKVQYPEAVPGDAVATLAARTGKRGIE